MSMIGSRLPLVFAAALLAAGAAAQTAPPVPRRPAEPAEPYVCDHGRAAAEVKRLTQIGIVIEFSEFPPNVSILADKSRWRNATDTTRRRWVQDVACATGERYASMLRTITVRARDTSLLGSYSSRDLKD